MSSILDNALLVGKESTYGTAAALSRAYEGKSDSFKRAQEFLTSTGFRGGMHTQLATRSVPVNMGGEGSIEVDVQPTGFGLLFQSMLGGTTAPTQQGATTAYTSTFVSTAAGPTDSWTVQMQRVDAGGTVRSFTHLGSTMTGWKFTQETDGLLGVEFMFDFQDVVTSVSAGTPTYVDSLPYAWTQAAATWDGTAVDLSRTLTYKGLMYSGVPNLASCFGYTNASWTLKCDLSCEYVCRLLQHMKDKGLSHCTPRNTDPSITAEPWVDLTSGYFQRAMHLLPRQGSRPPWKLYQNYPRDLLLLRYGRVDDGVLEFARAR